MSHWAAGNWRGDLVLDTRTVLYCITDCTHLLLHRPLPPPPLLLLPASPSAAAAAPSGHVHPTLAAPHAAALVACRDTGGQPQRGDP